MVARGYSQILLLEFMENYSPVVHDITFCLLLIAKMIYELSAKIVNAETSLLYGDLDKEIFMNSPEGLPLATDQDALKLQKCIHGLVQATRQYDMKMVDMLKHIGFKEHALNPCLYMKRDENGLIYVALYVDDNLLI